jgi:hypothetical protein
MSERFEQKVHRYVLMRNHSEFITILCRCSDTSSMVHYENDSCPNAKCLMFSAPTAAPVVLGKAVPNLADGVKVPLKFEKPIFTLRPASLHG